MIMGRSSQSRNFLLETPEAEDLIFKEDDYVRRNVLSTPDPSVRSLLLPLWRIRSQYRDTILPIRRNISEVTSIKPLIAAGIAAMSVGDISHPGIQLIIIEAAQSVQVYTTYLTKLRALRTNTDYIFHSYALHATDMVENFRRTLDVDGVYSADFSHRIVCALEMCLLLRRALNDSIETGKDVLLCALDNLKEMAHYYFVTNTEIPRQPQMLGYAIMKSYWNDFKRQGQKQNCSLSPLGKTKSKARTFKTAKAKTQVGVATGRRQASKT